VKALAQLLNDMRSAGVVQEYAMFGAIAQMRYTEPVATVDADVLVVVPPPGRPDVLYGIYEFCAAKGYRPEGEAISVGAWLWHRLLGGQRLIMGDYVRGPACRSIPGDP